MASANRSTGPTFPTALAGGLLAAVVVIAVAWAAMGPEVAIPITILAVICSVVALAYRTLGTGSRAKAADSTEGGLPTLAAEESRPLGDTPDAHDEINPHDLPPDHPGRHEAERMAQGDGGTSGMTAGGAAGAGGSEQGGGEGEPRDEAREGARTTGQ
ncbi:MAG TPA: hypothetical protein VGW75_13795 [Solirubrobacteraceae bacterium]|jgi:uncharacterized membrane protein YgcG|nr:hypothetical protein [Solirubrobacteraceae bacterium]